MKFDSDINIRAKHVDGSNMVTISYSPDLTMAEVISVLEAAQEQTFGMFKTYLENNEINEEHERFVAFSELPIKHML